MYIYTFNLLDNIMYFKSRNSIRKTTVLSFLFLANIILLIHAVVPHHHHEDTGICFTNSHTREHEENSYPEKCCIIDNNYTLAENKIKTSCHMHTKCNCGQLLSEPILTTLYIHDFVNDTQIHFQQNPYVPLFYSEFVSLSIGLRAPPVC